MRKIFSTLIASMIFLLIIGIFATAVELDVQDKEFVRNFIEKRGIKSESIKNISKIDFENLPKEINIENINEANLAIYEINYEENAEDKKIFMITYSTEKLEAQKEVFFQDVREFLNFGFSGESSESRFLNTGTGVETSLEGGYVMMRTGSITGISTNLISEGEGKIEIIIYKNGEPIGFGNTIIINSKTLGIKKDFDIQSKDIVSFEQGDVISVYVKIEGNVTWKDVITLIEITVN